MKKAQKLRILAFSDLHGDEKALKVLAKKAKKAEAKNEKEKIFKVLKSVSPNFVITK